MQESWEGADKTDNMRDFVDTVRELGATPHVAQNNTNRRSGIDERTTRRRLCPEPQQTMVGRVTVRVDEAN
jgi:hypothetical protein